MDTTYAVPGYLGSTRAAFPRPSHNFQTGVPGTTVAARDDRQLPSLQMHPAFPQANLTPQSTPLHLSGQKYPIASNRPSGAYTNADIRNEYVHAAPPLPHQAEYDFQISETSMLAQDTKRIEPHELPQTVFKIQSRKRPATSPLSDEDARVQKEEARARKEKLKELGGACVWCCQNKRACDPQTVCDGCTKRNVPCLHAHQQVWLYRNTARNSSQPSNSTSSRFPTLPRVKRQTFEHVNVLLHRLRFETLYQGLAGQGVLQIHWRFPNDSGTMTWDSKLLKEPVQDYSVPQEQMDSLLNFASRLVPLPELSVDSAFLDDALFSPVLKMVRLVGFLTSLSRAEVFGRVSDRVATRLALVHLIAGVAMTISQFSAKFAIELVRKLKLKRNNAVMLRELYIATGLYLHLIHALGVLKQGSLIVEILSGMTSQLDSVAGLVGHLLRTEHLAQSPIKAVRFNKEDLSKLKEQRFKEDFEKYIPRVSSLGVSQVAFYVSDENAPRNSYAFRTRSLMTVSQLLTEPIQLPATTKIPPAPIAAESQERAALPMEEEDPWTGSISRVSCGTFKKVDSSPGVRMGRAGFRGRYGGYLGFCFCAFVLCMIMYSLYPISSLDC